MMREHQKRKAKLGLLSQRPVEILVTLPFGIVEFSPALHAVNPLEINPHRRKSLSAKVLWLISEARKSIFFARQEGLARGVLYIYFITADHSDRPETKVRDSTETECSH